MSYYFKFLIPLNSDGTRVTYSPGWHGEMPRCPNGVKVLLYNDKEGYGIAQTEDSFVPKEVKVIEEKEALALIAGAEAENVDGVFFGEKLANRWNPEALVEEVKSYAELSIDPQPYVLSQEYHSQDNPTDLSQWSFGCPFGRWLDG